jgi:hypothetical protein
VTEPTDTEPSIEAAERDKAGRAIDWFELDLTDEQACAKIFLLMESRRRVHELVDHELHGYSYKEYDYLNSDFVAEVIDIREAHRNEADRLLAANLEALGAPVGWDDFGAAGNGEVIPWTIAKVKNPPKGSRTSSSGYDAAGREPRRYQVTVHLEEIFPSDRHGGDVSDG